MCFGMSLPLISNLPTIFMKLHFCFSYYVISFIYGFWSKIIIKDRI